jgi:hypothetical protein
MLAKLWRSNIDVSGERAATLALEEEVVPKVDDTISSLDDDTSSRDATVVAHLHAQAVVVQDV